MGYLGIDIGSTTVKVVLLNSNRVHLAPPIYSRSNGNPRRALNKALVVIHEHFSGPVRIGITGSGRKIARSLLGLPPSNCLTEINAHALGAWHERPDVRSVIDIGGQDSKIIRLKPGKHGTPEVEDFMMNELCASGTGAFFGNARPGTGVCRYGRLFKSRGPPFCHCGWTGNRMSTPKIDWRLSWKTSKRVVECECVPVGAAGRSPGGSLANLPVPALGKADGALLAWESGGRHRCPDGDGKGLRPPGRPLWLPSGSYFPECRPTFGCGQGMQGQLPPRLAGPNRSCSFDLDDPSDPKRFLDTFGRLDVLILSAADVVTEICLGYEGPEERLKRFRRCCEVNLFAQIRLITFALPLLRQSRGTVCFISSASGKIGSPCGEIFTATKHAMHGYLDSIRDTYAQGVQICLPCPLLDPNEKRPEGHGACRLRRGDARGDHGPQDHGGHRRQNAGADTGMGYGCLLVPSVLVSQPGSPMGPWRQSGRGSQRGGSDSSGDSLRERNELVLTGRCFLWE